MPVEGWSARPFPPRTPMVGRWCRVEPLDVARHAGELHDANLDDREGRNWTYLSSEPFRRSTPLRAAAERLGFRFEGVFRQAVVYKGRNRDSAWFSITDGEWLEVKAAFERWLDPSNFDEPGIQRSSLRGGLPSPT